MAAVTVRHLTLGKWHEELITVPSRFNYPSSELSYKNFLHEWLYDLFRDRRGTETFSDTANRGPVPKIFYIKNMNNE